MSRNTLFPGRPNYTGFTAGIFGLLHHDILVESSNGVMERVSYVRRFKPRYEIAIRLHNMIYLGDCQEAVDYLDKCAAFRADYDAQCAPYYADYMAKRAPLCADYMAKRALLCADKAKRVALNADYDAKIAPIGADYDAKCAPLYADYKAKCGALYADILTYIRSHIPDCAWNGKTLEFRT